MRSTPSSSFILLTRHILAYWTPTKFCIRACFRKYLIKTYLYHLYVYCISGKTVVLPTVRCTTKKYIIGESFLVKCGVRQVELRSFIRPSKNIAEKFNRLRRVHQRRETTD